MAGGLAWITELKLKNKPINEQVMKKFYFTFGFGQQYENCYRIYLPHNSAVVVRIDGRAFHTFTKGFARPYDTVFARAMWETAQQLCENISGCKFAYTQSDEITLILTDYEDIKTEPWFGNNLQKIVSISASMATYYFNKAFYQAMEDEYLDWYIDGEESKSLMTHSEAYNERIACFDARAFIVPREEIFNVLYWRQLDCVRNSIQLLGHFKKKVLIGQMNQIGLKME